jgi:predicted TIM-barrel fold metal-dependent hydrolase
MHAARSASAFSIVDGHVHFIHPHQLQAVLDLMDAVPCGRFNLVCIPNLDGSTTNSAAVFCKQRHPARTYISGALDYRVTLADPARGAQDLAAQVAGLKKAGFDGLKLIEGKPMVRKLLPYALDGPLYAGMWAALEEAGLPVVFHVADPDVFWSADACPEWARREGWDYSDGQYPTKEALYAEVDNILDRHPGLKIIFAHFYFLSHDLERAARFFEAHPSVCFDLAPHMEMYLDFSQQPEAARAFFMRYQDRIVYGTDIDTRVLERGPEGLRWMQSIPGLIRSFLETDAEFSLHEGPGAARYHGLGLPVSVLEKVYHANFERLYGPSPAELRLF